MQQMSPGYTTKQSPNVPSCDRGAMLFPLPGRKSCSTSSLIIYWRSSACTWWQFYLLLKKQLYRRCTNISALMISLAHTRLSQQFFHKIIGYFILWDYFVFYWRLYQILYPFAKLRTCGAIESNFLASLYWCNAPVPISHMNISIQAGLPCTTVALWIAHGSSRCVMSYIFLYRGYGRWGNLIWRSIWHIRIGHGSCAVYSTSINALEYVPSVRWEEFRTVSQRTIRRRTEADMRTIFQYMTNDIALLITLSFTGR